MLNILWSGFFLAAFIVACGQALMGNISVWNDLVSALFNASKSAFSVSLNLTGVLCLWLGLLKIAERSGITSLLSRMLRPLFRRIMPDIPEDSPALGSVVMNMAANVLGLDNAATPMGLKAMEQLQEYNPHLDKASPAQILFMVINTSAVTLIPITILMYRSELGASVPAAVFIPILLATSASTLAGFFSVAWVLKLPVFNRVVLSYLLLFCMIVGGTAFAFLSLDADSRVRMSAAVGNFVLFSVIAVFLLSGIIRRLNVYETFIEGAKEGFGVAVGIIPYLVAMLVGIAVFRASGAMDYLILFFEKAFAFTGWDNGFIPALPTAFLKPLSGSGARAMMIETMQAYGADSFPAFVSCIVQGSTETTFYVLAVYFGAVKITKVGAALPCALIADLVGIVSAVILAYYFY